MEESKLEKAIAVKKEIDVAKRYLASVRKLFNSMDENIPDQNRSVRLKLIDSNRSESDFILDMFLPIDLASFKSLYLMKIEKYIASKEEEFAAL